jgi:hypothetical protein
MGGLILWLAFAVLLIGTGYDSYQTLRGVTSAKYAYLREGNNLTQWFMAKLGVRTGALLKTIGLDLVMLGGAGVAMVSLIEQTWPAVAVIWVGAGIRQWQAGRTWVPYLRTLD